MTTDVTASAATLDRVSLLRTTTITDIGKYLPVARLAGVASAALASVADPRFAEAQAYSEAQSGAGLIVMVGGRIVHEAYGAGVTADTRLVSHSLHKSLLGLAVGAALNDGIIASLDDPLGRYLTVWDDDPRGAITLRQAMAMASGLTLYSLAAGGGAGLELNYGEHISATALAVPAAEPPGLSFNYNNANAQLVGLALSAALQSTTGEDYAAFVSRRLWQPLGNADAELWLDREGGDPHYFAGVHARLRDWAAVGEMLRTGAGLVSDSFRQAMQTPSAHNPNFGLLLWLGSPADGKRRYNPGNPYFVPHSAPFAAPDMVLMDGFGGQRVYSSAARQLVIARAGEISFGYDDAVIPNLVIAALDAD